MPQYIAKDEHFNKTLTKMWDLNNKIAVNKTLTEAEKMFYNLHLPLIKEYYAIKATYWKVQKEL